MKKISEIFFRGKWLKKEEFDKKMYISVKFN